MHVSYATEPAPGAVNEDYVITGPSWVVVLDGATAPRDVPSGCVHDVVWLVRNLAAALAVGLASDTGPLPDLLADAIGHTRGLHRDTCDLNNPSSPSSTVAMLREYDGALDYLCLADSPILLDTGNEVCAVVDDAIARLPSRTLAAVTEARNVDGGFWVAGTDERAAAHAVHGSLPTCRLTRAAVLTDGAARYVDRFALGDWADLLGLLERGGPDELIRRVRTAERADPPGERRGKLHDDATAVLVRPSRRAG